MAEMRAEMVARESAVQQLQAEVDDSRVTQASMPTAFRPAEPKGTTDRSEEDEVTGTGTGRSEPPPAAPFLARSGSQIRHRRSGREIPKSVARSRRSPALVYHII